jgi:hypothetical protein
MKSDRTSNEGGEVGVELKYCEHCGGLWVRERGAGTVYCDRCQNKVADLPAPKKKAGRLVLPVAPRTVVDDYAMDLGEDETDFEAAGGAA